MFSHFLFTKKIHHEIVMLFECSSTWQHESCKKLVKLVKMDKDKKEAWNLKFS